MLNLVKNCYKLGKNDHFHFDNDQNIIALKKARANITLE